MPTYTVLDEATNKKIKFEWNGSSPPTEQDYIDIFSEARKAESTKADTPRLDSKPAVTMQNRPTSSGKYTPPTTGATGTFQNIAKGYPALETAANLVTSAYGVPVSGLAGLFALPFGADKAAKTVDAVQKATIYQPQTKGGKELTEAATYPMNKLNQAAGATGEYVNEKTGSPALAAVTHATIAGIPVIISGGKILTKPSPTKVQASAVREMNHAIDRGIEKAVRPSIVKMEMFGQLEKYKTDARTTVTEIIKNKDKLNLVNEYGDKVEGLPKTLKQFSQAIEQTKQEIFKEYDSLAKQSDTKGALNINLAPIGQELATSVLNNKILKDFSPETVEYAQARIKSLNGRGSYTAVETQEAIQLLNQTLEAFYKDPTPAMRGRAMVDAMIANNLRKQLDKTIESTTGAEYQALKTKYGAVRRIETDVTKRSIVDARKNNKGLLDFSDIYTGYHIVKGIISADPTTAIAGGAAKGMKHYLKLMNDPNRIIKNMFSDVEGLMDKPDFKSQWSQYGTMAYSMNQGER